MLKSRHTVPARAWLLLLLAGVAGMLFYIDRLQTKGDLRSYRVAISTKF